MNGIFTSPRFWLIVVIGVLQSLVVFKVIDGVQAESLVQIVQSVLAGIVTVRTVDKLGENKEGATTVSMPENVSSVTATKKKK